MTPKIINNISFMLVDGEVREVINNSKYEFDTDYCIHLFENAVKNLKAGLKIKKSLDRQKYELLNNKN